MNSTPRCTHCGYQFDVDDTWPGGHEVSFEEDGQSDLECPKCNRTFHVICEHQYHFKNVQADGEDLI